MGNKKKLVRKNGGAQIGLNHNELRTAGLSPDDWVEVEPQHDRIIITRFKE